MAERRARQLQVNRKNIPHSEKRASLRAGRFLPPRPSATGHARLAPQPESEAANTAAHPAPPATSQKAHRRSSRAPAATPRSARSASRAPRDDAAKKAVPCPVHHPPTPAPAPARASWADPLVPAPSPAPSNQPPKETTTGPAPRPTTESAPPNKKPLAQSGGAT